MNDREILKYLKQLSAIFPEEGFAVRSRSYILATPHERPHLSFFMFISRPLAAGAFAVVFLALAGAAAIGLRPMPSYGALSAPHIRRELDNLKINIHLQEIELAQSVDNMIASAITEISDTKPVRHLNKTLLETEQLKFAPAPDGEYQESIDELLERVIF